MHNTLKHIPDGYIKNFAAAILLQAVKDFCYGGEATKKAVLEDLKSSWMSFLTDGESDIVAEQLMAHPKEIRQRIIRMEKEE